MTMPDRLDGFSPEDMRLLAVSHGISIDDLAAQHLDARAGRQELVAGTHQGRVRDGPAGQGPLVICPPGFSPV